MLRPEDTFEARISDTSTPHHPIHTHHHTSGVVLWPGTEGTQASGTSKKTELKLTNVARAANLEELRLDYEDFLRQRGLQLWPPDDPALLRFKARRCATVEQVRGWLGEELELLEKDLNTQKEEHGRTPKREHRRARTDTDQHGQDAERARTARDPGLDLVGRARVGRHLHDIEQASYTNDHHDGWLSGGRDALPNDTPERRPSEDGGEES